VAAVDIGTNSMRLLIARVGDGLVEWEDRRTAVTGLGRGVDLTGELASDRIEATIRALTAYGLAMDAAEVAARRAVATSATRDAANREEFLEWAEAALGVRPDVISGDEEAALAFSGATAEAHADGPFLVIDIGGGSTEFVYGLNAPEFRASLDMGSVRLTDRDFADRPPSVDQLEAARAGASAALAEVNLSGEIGVALGVAGTFTSLAAIDQDLPAYDPGRVNGHLLTRERLAELVLYLAGLSLEETEAIPSLDPARAPVILAGAVIAEAALARIGIDEVTVSEHDLLDGIVLGLADQI
jgi:exopolyphosphatase/guanosine-5'-triphosphate,3'-diphosphate pyrophosphatase